MISNFFLDQIEFEGPIGIKLPQPEQYYLGRKCKQIELNKYYHIQNWDKQYHERLPVNKPQNYFYDQPIWLWGSNIDAIHPRGVWLHGTLK